MYCMDICFVIICVIETGHQLDWTDKPVRYPRVEVSLYDSAHCRYSLGFGCIDLKFCDCIY